MIERCVGNNSSATSSIICLYLNPKVLSAFTVVAFLIAFNKHRTAETL
jgi:hypothetical protein